jgi:tRNA (guanosine-2'-O-)-methyltransferase
MLHLNPEREQKLKRAAAYRQHDLSVILENVHDPHNLGAVMRTCDCVGISEIFVIYTEQGMNSNARYIGINSASGSKKWVDVHFFESVLDCLAVVRQKYQRILGTHLSVDASSIYKTDLAGPVVLAFGNEHTGLSYELLHHLDGNVIIPQYGMVQSLNISVACAVTLFEASRQRSLLGKYDAQYDENNALHREYYQKMLKGHNPRAFP